VFSFPVSSSPDKLHLVLAHEAGGLELAKISSALRPMLLSWTSSALRAPSGSMIKVPRSDKPTPSM
jgi:hypothetical protein